MKYLFAFTLLILIGCRNSADKNESNKNSDVTEKDIYEVVNFVLTEKDKNLKNEGIKNMSYKYLIDKVSEPLFDEYITKKKLDTIFSKVDFKFIQQQIQSRKNFIFKNKYIKSKEVISDNIFKDIKTELKQNPKKNFYDIYDEKFGRSNLYLVIRLPVFSKDKKTVYVEVAEFGSGYSAIYKKVNGKWKFGYYLCHWIA